MITTEQVRAFVSERQESDLPDAVLEVFQAYSGRAFTKRLLDKLPGKSDRWTITQVAGMTNLESKDYRSSQGNRGISLLVAYAVKNVVIDPVFLEERNPAYFSARRERNLKRVEVMNDIPKLTAMVVALNGVIEARQAFERASKRLEDLTAYGEDFSPDKYDFEKVAEGKLSIDGGVK